VNPPAYDKWPELWPPVAEALLEAAERSGAVLVTAANLYPYGPVSGGLMREGMPDSAPGKKARVRAKMTADAFAAHQAGRIRAVEVHGSDYMGAGPGDYAHVPRVIAKALQGKTVSVVGSADQPHTWTDVRDMGRALATVATEESSWGRVWHAPSNAPRTQAEAVNDVLASVGAKAVTVRAMPNALLTLAAPFVPILRELRERRPLAKPSHTCSWGLMINLREVRHRREPGDGRRPQTLPFDLDEVRWQGTKV